MLLIDAPTRALTIGRENHDIRQRPSGTDAGRLQVTRRRCWTTQPPRPFWRTADMVLAQPLPTRALPGPTRTRPHLVAMPTGQPLSSLDLRMRRLSAEHIQHADGPVFPCPRCFTPPIGL
jgi:hypothetical protein